MCGRFTQYRPQVRYLERLNSQAPLAFEPSDTLIERYNVAPTTQVQLILLGDGGLRMQATPWGYAPHWARGTGKRPPAINARLETAVTSRYWASAWKSGRCLVPADGWFEWVTDPNTKSKQPYFIKLKSDEPMFFAAIGQSPREPNETSDTDGFAIVTTASDQGLLDIHDRMPVVLPPDVANEWLETGLAPERAEGLAKHHGESVESFEWYKVGKEVGNVANKGRELIAMTDR